ncbi:RNA 2',3'-cyclic phosphodiesterase [Halococcus saccharolyticus]|uniref:RNA 2',3'-cyclic phosphodiesterase n=1 Tax=Halococcus saccharolyticus DSM 5350 TaxID=1227455 RepID=M0MBS5_9EURY|nr:RNA 2',3'-cyclic phosphodiesterase [Halococcus saccharolyticus]EMA42798.1 2'-5' RNA ligase [Halococcus saccharolyticus DSM 5350]
MRLFVSVDLDGLAEEIAAVQETIADASGVRLTDPGNVHVTLKFLGEVEADRVSDLRENLAEAVDEAGVEPFEAAFGGFGAFPSEEYIRVLWIGVREGGDELARLHEAIEDWTVETGFDPADHEFTPHATIARMDHAGGKDRVQRALREDDPTVGTLDIGEVRLTESVLADDGPEYTTVERFAL